MAAQPNSATCCAYCGAFVIAECLGIWELRQRFRSGAGSDTILPANRQLFRLDLVVRRVHLC